MQIFRNSIGIDKLTKSQLTEDYMVLITSGDC